jgi:hypothetical protein
MGAAQPHIATHVSHNTIAGADKLSTHTAHAIGTPTAWRTSLHQTRLHDDMATYTPDTSIRKDTSTRPQALCPSPRISRDSLQMPARTPLPAPTNSVHTRRTQLAHPPPGSQLCTRHGSMVTYRLTRPVCNCPDDQRLVGVCGNAYA